MNKNDNNSIDNIQKYLDKLNIIADTIYKEGCEPEDFIIFNMREAINHIEDIVNSNKELLLKLPVQIGAEVWKIINRIDDVSGHTYKVKTRTNFRLDMLNEIGKTVFLTEEDAEEALNKL